VITNTQITKCRRYSTLYTDVKVKRFVKHMNGRKCKEILYHANAHPESITMVSATENVLEIEAK